MGHNGAAKKELAEAIKIIPADKLAEQLLEHIEQPQPPAELQRGSLIR